MTTNERIVTTQEELDQALADPRIDRVIIDSPDSVWLELATDRKDVTVGIRGSSLVGPVSGWATVSDVSGWATVRGVWGSATVRDVSGWATVSGVWGWATVRDVWGWATVSDVRGLATVSGVSDGVSTPVPAWSAGAGDGTGSACSGDDSRAVRASGTSRWQRGEGKRAGDLRFMRFVNSCGGRHVPVHGVGDTADNAGLPEPATGYKQLIFWSTVILICHVFADPPRDSIFSG